MAEPRAGAGVLGDVGGDPALIDQLRFSLAKRTCSSPRLIDHCDVSGLDTRTRTKGFGITPSASRPIRHVQKLRASARVATISACKLKIPASCQAEKSVCSSCFLAFDHNA